MAFKKIYDERVGQTELNAYHRLDGIEIDVAAKVLRITIKIYKDGQAVTDGKPAIKDRSYVIKNWVEEDGTPHNDFNGFFTQTPAAAATVRDALLKALYVWIKANVAYYADATEV